MEGARRETHAVEDELIFDWRYICCEHESWGVLLDTLEWSLLRGVYKDTLRRISVLVPVCALIRED